MPAPPRLATAAKPCSSVKSSPMNKGRVPANSGSVMNAFIASPLVAPVGVTPPPIAPRPDVVHPERHAERQPCTVREPQLQPVRARKGDAVQRQMALEVGERAAGDDRDPPLQPSPEPFEQRREPGRDRDRIGRFG